MAIIWVGTGRFSAYIGPVQDYIDRVVAADVAAGNTLGLEVGVRDAYDVFIRDSINVGDLGTSGGVLSQANSIIKAAPIMAGARTLAGALVPLVGTAPTNFNFVAGDYNRKTGLVGDGTSKYLNSNRNNNADPRDSKHCSFYYSNIGNASAVQHLGTAQSFGNTMLRGSGSNAADAVVAINSGNVFTIPISYGLSSAGFASVSRASSDSFSARINGATTVFSSVSVTPLSENIFIFRRGTDNLYSNARLAFYSIGESLNLALLDARVTTLMNALAAAIP
jgi:hypothetical protein